MHVLGRAGEPQPGAREHRRDVVAVRCCVPPRSCVGEIGGCRAVARDELVDLAPERRRARLSSSSRAHSSRRAAVSASRSMCFTVPMTAEAPRDRRHPSGRGAHRRGRRPRRAAARLLPAGARRAHRHGARRRSCCVLFALVASWLLSARTSLDPAVVPILTIVVLVLVMVVIPTVVETTIARPQPRAASPSAVASSASTAARRASATPSSARSSASSSSGSRVGAVAALVGAFTPRSQRLGDLLAGTYSERTRTPRAARRRPRHPADARRVGGGRRRRAAAGAARAAPRAVRRARRANMEPAARARVAASLAGEVGRARLTGAGRRPRDVPRRRRRRAARARAARARSSRAQRVDALTSAVADAPRGFPRALRPRRAGRRQ